MGKRIEQIPEATMNAFSTYDWPGNVRELQNLVERAVIRSDNGVLPNPIPRPQISVSSAPKFKADLSPVVESDRRIEAPAMTELQFTDSLEAIQRQHILRVLERTGWVISGPSGAGAILKIHPNTLRSLMDRLGIRRNAMPRARRGHECSQPTQSSRMLEADPQKSATCHDLQ
jgi:formate hydrogenlyase transcriptional activator